VNATSVMWFDIKLNHQPKLNEKVKHCVTSRTVHQNI